MNVNGMMPLSLATCQSTLQNVLYVYASKHNGNYHQGFNELAAMLLYAYLCTPSQKLDGLEADLYASFTALMLRVGAWYSDGEKLSNKFSAVIQRCFHMQNIILLQLDPLLSSHLTDIGIERQIYALRWYRLLFLREFPISEALVVWDNLLAQNSTSSNSLELCDFLAAGILMSLRNILLQNDPNGCLKTLMKDPAAAGSQQLLMFAKRLHATYSKGLTVHMKPKQTVSIAMPVNANQNTRFDFKSALRNKKLLSSHITDPAASAIDTKLDVRSQSSDFSTSCIDGTTNEYQQIMLNLSEVLAQSCNALETEYHVSMQACRAFNPDLFLQHLAQIKQVKEVLSGRLLISDFLDSFTQRNAPVMTATGSSPISSLLSTDDFNGNSNQFEKEMNLQANKKELWDHDRAASTAQPQSDDSILGLLLSNPAENHDSTTGL